MQTSPAPSLRPPPAHDRAVRVNLSLERDHVPAIEPADVPWARVDLLLQSTDASPALADEIGRRIVSAYGKGVPLDDRHTDALFYWLPPPPPHGALAPGPLPAMHVIRSFCARRHAGEWQLMARRGPPSAHLHAAAAQPSAADSLVARVAVAVRTPSLYVAWHADRRRPESLRAMFARVLREYVGGGSEGGARYVPRAVAHLRALAGEGSTDARAPSAAGYRIVHYGAPGEAGRPVRSLGDAAHSGTYVVSEAAGAAVATVYAHIWPPMGDLPALTLRPGDRLDPEAAADVAPAVHVAAVRSGGATRSVQLGELLGARGAVASSVRLATQLQPAADTTESLGAARARLRSLRPDTSMERGRILYGIDADSLRRLGRATSDASAVVASLCQLSDRVPQVYYAYYRTRGEPRRLAAGAWPNPFRRPRPRRPRKSDGTITGIYDDDDDDDDDDDGYRDEYYDVDSVRYNDEHDDDDDDEHAHADGDDLDDFMDDEYVSDGSSGHSGDSDAVLGDHLHAAGGRDDPESPPTHDQLDKDGSDSGGAPRREERVHGYQGGDSAAARVADWDTGGEWRADGDDPIDIVTTAGDGPDADSDSGRAHDDDDDGDVSREPPTRVRTGPVAAVRLSATPLLGAYRCAAGASWSARVGERFFFDGFAHAVGVPPSATLLRVAHVPVAAAAATATAATPPDMRHRLLGRRRSSAVLGEDGVLRVAHAGPRDAGLYVVYCPSARVTLPGGRGRGFLAAALTLEVAPHGTRAAAALAATPAAAAVATMSHTAPGASGVASRRRLVRDAVHVLAPGDPTVVVPLTPVEYSRAASGRYDWLERASYALELQVAQYAANERSRAAGGEPRFYIDRGAAGHLHNAAERLRHGAAAAAAAAAPGGATIEWTIPFRRDNIDDDGGGERALAGVAGPHPADFFYGYWGAEVDSALVALLSLANAPPRSLHGVALAAPIDAHRLRRAGRDPCFPSAFAARGGELYAEAEELRDRLAVAATGGAWDAAAARAHVRRMLDLQNRINEASGFYAKVIRDETVAQRLVDMLVPLP